MKKIYGDISAKGSDKLQQKLQQENEEAEQRKSGGFGKSNKKMSKTKYEMKKIVERSKAKPHGLQTINEVEDEDVS